MSAPTEPPAIEPCLRPPHDVCAYEGCTTTCALGHPASTEQRCPRDVRQEPGQHCHHWWEADPDDPNGTACHYCADDSTEDDDTYNERCPG